MKRPAEALSPMRRTAPMFVPIGVSSLRRCVAALWHFGAAVVCLRYFHEQDVVTGYNSFPGLDTRHRIAVVVLRNTFSWDDSIGGRLLVRLGRAQDHADGTPGS